MIRLIISFLFTTLSNTALSLILPYIIPEVCLFFAPILVLGFFEILLMAVWWHIIRKTLIKYHTNQTSICLKPLVLGKSPLLLIDPNNMTSTSNAVTEVRFRFVKSFTSYCMVKIAHNQSIKLGVIIWIIPFIDRRFNFNMIFKSLFEEQFRGHGLFSMYGYGELATSNWPTIGPPI